MNVTQIFCDDTLANFTEKLSADPTRLMMASILKKAKRNKVFNKEWLIGLAIDGTGAGRCEKKKPCRLCHPIKDKDGRITGYLHKFSAISVVAGHLTLPFDVEPYGPGDSEEAASQRLLERAVKELGKQFADYVVADGAYASAPFIHLARKLGLNIVIRLKGNVPTLFEQAMTRYKSKRASLVFQSGRDDVHLWDSDDFDPWESLTELDTIRVIRYVQRCPDGKTHEAYWFTDFSSKRVGGKLLYRLVKSRWDIENKLFNDAKNRYGIEHITHHHPNSILMKWLLTCLALILERLYRLVYLKRGNHPPLSAQGFCDSLWLSLGASLSREFNSS